MGRSRHHHRQGFFQKLYQIRSPICKAPSAPDNDKNNNTARRKSPLPGRKEGHFLQQAKDREEEREKNPSRFTKFKPKFSNAAKKQERKREEEAELRVRASTERWKARKEVSTNRFRPPSPTPSSPEETNQVEEQEKKGQVGEDTAELNDMMDLTSSILGDLELMAGDESSHILVPTPAAAIPSNKVVPILLVGRKERRSSRRLFR